MGESLAQARPLRWVEIPQPGEQGRLVRPQLLGCLSVSLTRLAYQHTVADTTDDGSPKARSKRGLAVR